MTWDTKIHPAITRARLLLSPPEEVCAALDEYNECLNNSVYARFQPYGSYRGSDEELEKLLLNRNDPLINISLARVATNVEVIRILWDHANSAPNLPASYRTGLRCAILSGNIPYSLFHDCLFKSNSSVEIGALTKILVEDNEGSAALLANPHAGVFLDGLFNAKPPFDEVDAERRAWLVYYAARNPRINVELEDPDSPDFEAWDIQKGILRMLETAPLDRLWFHALDAVLDNLDPERARCLHTTDIREVLSRWGRFGDGDNEGVFTSLTYIDEFRCKIAALYGDGRIDDPDIIMRCAYYGNQSLTPEQMDAGFKRDNDVFTFAALHNDSVFLNPKKRALLEDMRWGDRDRWDYSTTAALDRANTAALHRAKKVMPIYMLRNNQRKYYTRRCEQIHARIPGFQITPSETICEDEKRKLPSEEMEEIQLLNHEIRQLKQKIERLGSRMAWGLLILGGLLLWLRG